MDNRRKMHTATMVGNNWPEEVYQNTPRYANSKPYREQEEYDDERDMGYAAQKSSEETIVEIGESGANKNVENDYTDDATYVKMIPKQNNNAVRDKYQRFGDYADVPDALSAMQKLQRLKELQLKRDISERYYSQEIKRLIGEYYFGPRFMSPSARPAGKLQSTSFQPYTEDRWKNASKNLEQCGTMTTITRLDCGCIQETTRPIFTTAKGRVQKKRCSQSQDEILLKLSSSNPQEHLPSLLERCNDNYRAKLKKRMPMEPRMCPKIPPAGEQDFGTEDEKRNDEQEVEIAERIQRTTSPHQIISDTSLNSA